MALENFESPQPTTSVSNEEANSSILHKEEHFPVISSNSFITEENESSQPSNEKIGANSKSSTIDVELQENRYPSFYGMEKKEANSTQFMDEDFQKHRYPSFYVDVKNDTPQEAKSKNNIAIDLQDNEYPSNDEVCVLYII